MQGIGSLVSLNVGLPREFHHAGRLRTSAIWKSPVRGSVMARGVNLDGDDQADREVHGGPDKAIYAYAIEDTRFWEGELGRPLEPGEFGENLTTSGIDVTEAVVGERWEIGTALLEIAQPRGPCWKLGVKMNDPGFVKQFTEAGRPGAYLRIVREGVLRAGDPIRLHSRPGHGISIGRVFRIFAREQEQAELLLSVPELSENWKEWAQKQARSDRRRSRR